MYYYRACRKKGLEDVILQTTHIEVSELEVISTSSLTVFLSYNMCNILVISRLHLDNKEREIDDDLPTDF